MIEKISKLLRKWPILYRLAISIYWNLKPRRIEEILIGTKSREKYWANRSIAQGYWATMNHPSKSYLIDKISCFEPINSVLEVGCASGAHLYLLAQKYPSAKIVGVDINDEAIEYGNKHLQSDGISNVQLICSKADELDYFVEKSFDIVFTLALLVVVGPDKIATTIKQLLRISRRELILMECHSFGYKKYSKGRGFYYHGNWIRDYKALLKEFVDGEKIRISRIPTNVWPDEPWSQFGAVIEVDC